MTISNTPSQPGAFTASSASVNQGQTGVTYTVPNDATVTYNWSYSGTGATINGTGNSVTVNFSSTATGGTLSVTATNGCGTGSARSIAVAVNRVFAAGNLAILQVYNNADSTGEILELNPVTGGQSPLDSTHIAGLGSTPMRFNTSGTSAQLSSSNDGSLLIITGFDTVHNQSKQFQQDLQT